MKEWNVLQFQLPEYDSIADINMIRAIDFPLDRSMIVEWAPGTGKTVVALHRYLRAKEQGLRVVFLCFNKLLKEFIEKNIKEGDRDVFTLDGFVYHFKDASDKNRFLKDFSDEEIKELFHHIVQSSWKWQFDVIIIDEMQDLTIDILKNLHILAKNFTFCIDSRQTMGDIYNQKAQYVTIDDIYQVFSEIPKFILDRNYRNTREIYEWAAKRFFPQNEFVNNPNLTLNSPSAPDSIAEPFRGVNSVSKQCDIIEEIYKDMDPSETLGIFVPNRDSMDYIEGELRNRGIKIFGYNSYHSYGWGNLQKNMITTHQACKWLEFDVVIIISDKTESAYAHQRYYVLSTRAKKKLRFIFTF